MNTVNDIFNAVGGPSKMATLLNCKQSAASEMKRRGSIPAHYWAALIDGCREMGVRGINADSLVNAHARNRETAA